MSKVALPWVVCPENEREGRRGNSLVPERECNNTFFGEGSQKRPLLCEVASPQRTIDKHQI